MRVNIYVRFVGGKDYQYGGIVNGFTEECKQHAIHRVSDLRPPQAVVEDIILEGDLKVVKIMYRGKPINSGMIPKEIYDSLSSKAKKKHHMIKAARERNK